MKEHRNEKGELVAIETNEAQTVDIPDPQLRYIRPSMDQMFPAEICIKDGDYYCVFSVNRDQLINFIDESQKLLRQFDKRTPEDTYNG
jgi:hypothetical protein